MGNCDMEGRFRVTKDKTINKTDVTTLGMWQTNNRV